MRFSCASCDIEKTVDLADDPTPSCPNCGGALQFQPEPTNLAFSDSMTSELSSQMSSEVRQESAERPQRIGKYRIVSHVATGGFGAVYKGYDSLLDRYVAIKIPKKENLTGKRADEFIAEARTMAKLEHPNIVPILEAGRDDSQNVFLVMKWIDGCTLSGYARNKDLSVDETCKLMAKVCEAIHTAHKAGFVHRDLKPSNILVDSSAEPYVCDFGLAIHDSTQSLVRNQVAGTVSYMSPEQIEGRAHHLDGRTDIWSIGVILYELISQKKPFVAESKEALFEAILERPLKPLEQQIDGLPETLVQVVSKCLIKDVDHRIPSAKLVASELQSLKPSTPESEVAGSHSVKFHPGATAKSSSLGVKLFVIGILAFMAVAVGTALLYFKNRPESATQVDNSVTNVGVVKLLTDPKVCQYKLIGDSDSPKLQISSTGNTLVRVGNALEDEFKIEFELVNRWVVSQDKKNRIVTRGDVGFFIGLSNDRLQYFMIGLDGNKTNQYKVTRNMGKFDPVIGFKETADAGQAVVGDVQQKQPLKVRIHIKDGRLAGGNINGTDIHLGIVQNEEGWHANTKGQFGFFVCDTVCVFQNLKFNGKKVDYHD